MKRICEHTRIYRVPLQLSRTYGPGLNVVEACKNYRNDGGGRELITALVSVSEGCSALSVSDLLVVLIADAAQNGMAGEYKSLTEGGVIVATIFAWNYTLDWLA